MRRAGRGLQGRVPGRASTATRGLAARSRTILARGLPRRRRGRIRYHHFGEGEYAMTEMAIQRLLHGSGPGASVDQDLVMVEPDGPRGRRRLADAAVTRDLRRLPAERQGSRPGRRRATRRAADVPGGRAADGQSVGADGHVDGRATRRRSSNEPGGRIAFGFHARDVNLVMGPAARGDGDPLPGLARWPARRRTHSASDVGIRRVRVSFRDQRTYQLIRQSGPIRDRLFEVEFLDAGIEAYCFTFG